MFSPLKLYLTRINRGMLFLKELANKENAMETVNQRKLARQTDESQYYIDLATNWCPERFEIYLNQETTTTCK